MPYVSIIQVFIYQTEQKYVKVERAICAICAI